MIYYQVLNNLSDTYNIYIICKYIFFQLIKKIKNSYFFLYIDIIINMNNERSNPICLLIFKNQYNVVMGY